MCDKDLMQTKLSEKATYGFIKLGSLELKPKVGLDPGAPTVSRLPFQLIIYLFVSAFLIK